MPGLAGDGHFSGRACTDRVICGRGFFSIHYGAHATRSRRRAAILNSGHNPIAVDPCCGHRDVLGRVPAPERIADLERPIRRKCCRGVYIPSRHPASRSRARGGLVHQLRDRPLAERRWVPRRAKSRPKAIERRARVGAAASRRPTSGRSSNAITANCPPGPASESPNAQDRAPGRRRHARPC